MPQLDSIYALLKFEEGCRYQLYDDANGQLIVPGYHVIGHPTIGIGRRLDQSQALTDPEVNVLVFDDINKWYGALTEFTWFRALDPVRRWAIVSMAHTMGVAGVEKFSDMIASLTKEDWPAAHDAVMNSKWADEAKARATRVSEMLVTGAWPTVD